MGNSVIFSRIMDEYGSLERDEETASGADSKIDAGDIKGDVTVKKDILMQEEERVTGSVAWSTYRDYLRSAGGLIWFPIFLGLLILAQVASGEKVYNCANVLLMRDGFSREQSVSGILDW